MAKWFFIVSLVLGASFLSSMNQAQAGSCNDTKLTFVNNSSNGRGMLEIKVGDYQHGGKHSAENESSITYPPPKEFTLPNAPFNLAINKTKSRTLDLPIVCANKIKWVIQTNYGDKKCTATFKNKKETFTFKDGGADSQITMSCD